jgi:hypothetical protein
MPAQFSFVSIYYAENGLPWAPMRPTALPPFAKPLRVTPPALHLQESQLALGETIQQGYYPLCNASVTNENSDSSHLPSRLDAAERGVAGMVLSARNSSVNKSAKIVLVLRPAIPFLELRIEFYEFFLRQIGMSLLRHEFPEL